MLHSLKKKKKPNKTKMSPICDTEFYFLNFIHCKIDKIHIAILPAFVFSDCLSNLIEL